MVTENRFFFPDFQLLVIKTTATGQFMLNLNAQLRNYAESTNIVTCMSVTVDGVWIGNWIY
jgi:hypothetical protein